MTSPSTTYSKLDTADLEPDDDWKNQLKSKIKLRLQPLVQDLKDNQLKNAVVTPEDRRQLDIDYSAAMARIRQLATDQYQAELEEERDQRRQIVGAPVLHSSSTPLKAEQEQIVNTAYSHPPSPQTAASAPPTTRNPVLRKTRASNSPVASRMGYVSAMSSPGHEFVKSRKPSFEDAAKFGPERHRKGHSADQNNSSAGWWEDEPRDQEKRRVYRAIRSRPVGATVSGHNDPLEWRRGMRSAGPSFAAITEDRKLHSNNWTPHLDARDEQYPPYREPRYPSQDRVPPRPLSPRSYSAPPANVYPPQPAPPHSPYNDDDREYLAKRDFVAHSENHTPPPTFRSPVPSRSPYNDSYNNNNNNNNSYSRSPTRYIKGVKGSFRDRKYGPPSARKSSFNYDDHRREDWEWPNTDALWGNDLDHPPYNRRERERLDRERGRNGARDHDPYSNSRGHANHYAHDSPQRSASYHTLPPSISRHGSRDNFPMSDLYDTREPVPPSRRHSYRDLPQVPSPSHSAHPEYDYKYRKQESQPPMLRTRQGSYSRRESRDRRMENPEPGHDGYSDDEDPAVSDDDDVIHMKIAAAKLEHQAYELKQQRRYREEEARRKEEEARMKEDEFRKREAARKVVTRLKEQEVHRREREIREREQALYIREEELKRREAEAKIREEEKYAGARRVEQAERTASHDHCIQQQAEWPISDTDPPILDVDDLSDDLFLDPRPTDGQAPIWEEIQLPQQIGSVQRKHQKQRSRSGSLGADTSSSPYPPGGSPSQSPKTWSGQPSLPQTSQPSIPSLSELERSNATSPAWTGAGSAWSNSTKSISSGTSATSAPSSWSPNGTRAPKTVTNIPQGKSCNGSFSSDTYPAGSSPHSTPGTDEWQHRQTEFTNAQQEKFRHEQERLEADMQIRSAGKHLSREDMQRVFEKHERFWAQLPQKSDLTWNDFPWPMSKTPASPDDISSVLIGAYILSNRWPDRDKFKSTKDHIKDHLRRWHPDRFEMKLLPKVVKNEKVKVKQGAGNVARCLSALLQNELDNSGGGNIFGGNCDIQRSIPTWQAGKEEERPAAVIRKTVQMSMRITSDAGQRTMAEDLPTDSMEHDMNGVVQAGPSTLKNKYKESTSSDTIVSSHSMAAIVNNAGTQQQQQQQSHTSVSMSNAEEQVFAKATVVRYVAPNQLRRRQGSSSASRAVGTGTAIASVTPTPATSIAVNAAKSQKVTIEDVSDRDIDSHGESPPSTQFIFDEV